MLVKSAPEVNFIKILRAAFAIAEPEISKKTDYET